MAGVTSNFLFIVLLNFYNFSNNFCDKVIYFNYILLFINLLPVYSLDGYRIIRKILTKVFDELYVMDLLVYLSIIILLFSMILCFVFRLYFMIIIFIYLFIKLLINHKKEKKIIYLKTLSELIK